MYRVAGALVVVQVSDGRREVYLEAGARVPATADADCVRRLLAEGLLVEDAPAPDPVVDERAAELGPVEVEPVARVAEAPAFRSMNLDQLRQYAADHNIDLGGATRKDDIVAAIKAA